MQIAAYRDPELLPTLRDCLRKARHPENLVFGICWQRDFTERLDEFAGDKRFRVITIPWWDSKGVCWARNAIQSLYNGETYTLQLDSHHRFIQDWDAELIAMMDLVDSAKPLLTTYAPGYDPDIDDPPLSAPCMIAFDKFTPEGALVQRPAFFKESMKPIPARFYSAHFAFTWGCFCEEVPHDPNYYFHGEEINIAVRAFTHGYDLFHPPQKCGLA